LETAPNTKGVDLSIYDKNVDADEAQNELLLARNQKWKPDSIGAQDGTIYVKGHFI